jgi:hypothetical protein
LLFSAKGYLGQTNSLREKHAVNTASYESPATACFFRDDSLDLEYMHSLRFPAIQARHEFKPGIAGNIRLDAFLKTIIYYTSHISEEAR